MLDDKNADLVVFNDVSRADIGFDAAENEVVLVIARTATGRCPKALEERDRGRDPRRGGAALAGMSDAYDNFQEGRRRLKKGMPAQATVALEKAKTLEPDKASIREALGIAYFRLARWAGGRGRVPRGARALADRRLRALRARPRAREAGRTAEANGHYKLASSMDPGSAQYAARIRELD